MPLPQIHPREEKVRIAEIEIKKAIFEAFERHDLTSAEQLRILSLVLSSEIGGIAKYAIRIERHGDADKAGGFAPE